MGGAATVNARACAWRNKSKLIWRRGHQYCRTVREAFELWSQHIEALTTEKAAAA